MIAVAAGGSDEVQDSSTVGPATLRYVTRHPAVGLEVDSCGYAGSGVVM